MQQLLQTTEKLLNSRLKYSVFLRVFHFIVFLGNIILRTRLGEKQDANRSQNHFEIRTYALEFAYEVCVSPFSHVVKKYFLFYASVKNFIHSTIKQRLIKFLRSLFLL